MRGTWLEKEIDMCATNNQENEVHGHQCKEMGGKNCEDMW
jgi:hypothetical protein